MLWIYLTVTFIAGVFGSLLFRYLLKNKSVAYALTLLFIATALGLTYWYATPYYVAWRFESTISNQRSFLSLVATNSPDEFNAYVTKVKNNILSKGDPRNEVYYTAELINTLLIKYGPQASNKSLYDYLKADIDLDKKLFAIDPSLVLLHEFPDKFQEKISLKKYNAADIKNSMLEAVENVIISAIEHPQPLPSDQDLVKARELFQDIVANLSQQFGSQQIRDAFRQPDTGTQDVKSSAEILIGLSEAIYAKGQDRVGLLLKASFIEAKNSSKNQAMNKSWSALLASVI